MVDMDDTTQSEARKDGIAMSDTHEQSEWLQLLHRLGEEYKALPQLSNRARHCLIHAALGPDAARRASDKELLRIEGFWKRSLREVRAIIGSPPSEVSPSQVSLAEFTDLELLDELRRRVVGKDVRTAE